MPNSTVPAAAIGLPIDTLHELRDSLVLALDAIERDRPAERDVSEARAYLRHALRDTGRLMSGVAP